MFSFTRSRSRIKNSRSRSRSKTGRLRNPGIKHRHQYHVWTVWYLAAGQMAEELGELWLGQHQDPVGLKVQGLHHNRGVDKLTLENYK